ncbi:hypothetical protein J6590_063180 [Homalodisca vitripennis]|nr:hypothetical protein J6590_063180 [Homalodisca vitripennis]
MRSWYEFCFSVNSDCRVLHFCEIIPVAVIFIRLCSNKYNCIVKARQVLQSCRTNLGVPVQGYQHDKDGITGLHGTSLHSHLTTLSHSTDASQEQVTGHMGSQNVKTYSPCRRHASRRNSPPAHALAPHHPEPPGAPNIYLINSLFLSQGNIDINRTMTQFGILY